MTRRFAVAVALGTAALAFAADDPNAPLANTKQQLQSLKKEEAAQKAGTQRAAKFDLPALNTPGQELNLPALKREEADAKKKAADRKNWLLEGYDKLDKKSEAKRADGKASADEKPLDPDDPDYFLRLYERQRAERDANTREFDRLQMNERSGEAADPFAPFMKDWLANSPVREALKDSLGHQAIDAEMVPGAETVSSSASAAPAAPVIGEASRETGTNPFVQALGLPALELSRPVEGRSPTITVQSPPAVPTSPIPANTIYDLQERPKVDLKQALPPPPSEDKKYFPQLKKF